MTNVKFPSYEKKPSKIQNMNITYQITQEYSLRINSIRSHFYNKEKLLEDILQIMTAEYVNDIYVYKTEISASYNSVRFSAYNLRPLESVFQCFVFANVLWELYYSRAEKCFEFDDVRIELNESCGFVRIWFPKKKKTFVDPALKEW